MALSKGINSYVTVEEADSYFQDRLDVAAWTSADVTTKGQALVTATSILDGLAWTGVAISDNQPLAFPRTGSYFDPRVGRSLALVDVPARVLDATKELAYHLLNNDGLRDETGNVKSVAVGEIRLDFIQPPAKIPLSIHNMIKPLLANQGSNLWWRAN